MKSTLPIGALIVAAIAGAVAASQTQTPSRDRIQIAGSSTVLPFASIVAEEFGHVFPQYRTPVVGSGGSGGGLRQFCEGVGVNTIDVANSSRQIREAEIATCHARGVADIREIMFGYDGIVFATSITRGAFALTPEDIFRAAAAALPDAGGTVRPNEVTNWRQIRPDLPDQRIMLAIPATNHGTREVLEEKVLVPGCSAAYGEVEHDEDACLDLRQDVVTEIAGDYTETLARLVANPDTMGVFGLSFFDQNRDTLEVATINGVTPSLETIAAGDYPVARPLFFYVKGAHIGVVPGLEEYIELFLAEPISGLGGPLEDAGMIPAPRSEIEAVLSAFRQGAPATQ